MGYTKYSGDEDIVRGSRWPTSGDNLQVMFTNENQWPSDADTWTWSMLLDRFQRGGDADTTITASNASLNADETELTADFHLTATDSGNLDGSQRQMFYVSFKSDDGSGDVRYYGNKDGYVIVKSPAGAA